MASRPNIVLILADDLGYGDVGAYGNESVLTPSLDWLSSEGITLTQHYSASPMCAPARAALLTGKYPHRVGALDVVENRGLDRISTDELTIADHFKAAGYATGIVGKWHNGAIHAGYHPNARGFDEFVGFRAGMVTDYFDWVIEYNGRFERGQRYLTDVFTDEAVEFIDRHHAEPFFLYVPYNAPHGPLQAPDEDVAPFADMEQFTDPVCTIYGMNRRLDAGVGRIVETLARHGLSENTIILFTSDNGPAFHGSGDRSTVRYNGMFNGSKGSVLEGGIRVPGIVCWPAGLERGRQLDDMLHFSDWMPTLLSAAGVDVNAGDLDGQNVLPVLRGESFELTTRRFWQWNRYEPVANCNAAIRDGAWKLVRPNIPEALTKPIEDNDRTLDLVQNPERYTDIHRAPMERALSSPRDALLYDLVDDPGERHDRASDHPERVASMQLELDRWFEAMLRDLNQHEDLRDRLPTTALGV